MKAILLLGVLCIAINSPAYAQNKQESFWNPSPPNYEVNHAFEFESLVPMFLYGGYHFAGSYRYKKLRFRCSIINGGDYNADNQAVGEVDEGFERYYQTSPGFFLGYFLWKNLELYGYYEHHTFEVKQLNQNEVMELQSNDFGIGISYQFFVGKVFYIQPGVHSYFRKGQELEFTNGETYNLPTFELSPVVRIGVRIWKN